MPRNDRPYHEQLADYDSRGNRWLAEGNAYAEAGNKKKAEECYDKGQYWMDKSNALREKYAPRLSDA
jgi:hypothetical protein